MNSQLLKDDSQCPEIGRVHWEWLASVLPALPDVTPEVKSDDLKGDSSKKVSCKQRGQHTLMFSHIPPFINAPDEETEYFNIPLSKRSKLLTMAKSSGVSKWFSGHYHRNAGGWDGDLEVVVTSACGVQLLSQGNPLGLPVKFAATPVAPTTSGLRLVRVTKNTVQHKWFTIAAMPTRVNLKDDITSWV